MVKGGSAVSRSAAKPSDNDDPRLGTTLAWIRLIRDPKSHHEDRRRAHDAMLAAWEPFK